MNQYFMGGRATGVNIEHHLTAADAPAWGFELRGFDRVSLVGGLGQVASSLNVPLIWDTDDPSVFKLGRFGGSIVSPESWLFCWLDRPEVEAFLALLSGGVSLLPSSDGAAFEYVDREGSISRLNRFIDRIHTFLGSSSKVLGWQLILDKLDHETAQGWLGLLSATMKQVDLVDPREKYLFVGDRATALSLFAVTSQQEIEIVDEEETSVWTTPEDARTSLETFLADDLALFLEVGYPLALELSDPKTEIPVSGAKP